MTHKQHDLSGPKGIPLSAVYRQLDDCPSPEAAEYDPAAAVAQLMTRWASDDPAARPEEPAPLPVHKAAVQMLTIRHDLVVQLARRRFASTVMAYAAILGISGIAAATAALIPRLATPVLAGIALTAVPIVFAVVIIHRITMRSITRDHDRVLSENTMATRTDEEPTPVSRHAAVQPVGYRRPDERSAPLIDDDDDDDDDDDNRPRSRKLGFRLPLAATAAAATAITAAIHDGTGGIILLAATMGVLSLALLSLIATALFGSQPLSERAFRLLRTQADSRRERLR